MLFIDGFENPITETNPSQLRVCLPTIEMHELHKKWTEKFIKKCTHESACKISLIRTNENIANKSLLQ